MNRSNLARVHHDAAAIEFSANSRPRHGNSEAQHRMHLTGAKDLFDRMIGQGVFDPFKEGMSGDARRDSQTLAVASRQLEYVMTQLYEEPQPDLLMATGQIIDINTEVPDGAKTFTWYAFSGRSMARFTDGWGSGRAPMTTITQAEKSGVTKSMEGFYAYTMQDMRHAGFSGVPLEAMLAKHDRRGHLRLLDDTGLWGREEIGLPGLITNPNITILDAPLNADASSTTWPLKSAAEILVDLGTLVQTAGQLSFGMRRTTHVWLPRFSFDLISRTMVTTLADSTILDWAKRVHPGVEFGVLDQLAATQSTDQHGTQHLATDSAIAIVKNAEILSLVVPMDYTQMPPQFVDLKVKVSTESMTGGVINKEPPTVVRMDGIGAT